MSGQPTSQDLMRMQILMQLARNTEMIAQALQSTTALSPQQTALFGSIIGNNNIITMAVNSVVNISAQQFNGLPAELTQALQSFAGEINKQVQTNKIPTEEVAQIQQSLVELGKEAEGVEAGKVKATKKVSIKAKLMSVENAYANISLKLPRQSCSLLPLRPLQN